ncbi:MAG: hypothetical protein RLZZ157_1951, partial [Pseudomonadota bacterium]
MERGDGVVGGGLPRLDADIGDAAAKLCDMGAGKGVHGAA